MKYYRVGNDYIATVGTIDEAEEVTEAEFARHYTEVLEEISHYPEEPTAEDIINILLGGEV